MLTKDSYVHESLHILRVFVRPPVRIACVDFCCCCCCCCYTLYLLVRNIQNRIRGIIRGIKILPCDRHAINKNDNSHNELAESVITASLLHQVFQQFCYVSWFCFYYFGEKENRCGLSGLMVMHREIMNADFVLF